MDPRTDHILSLQQPLAHYEWMLSQLHPTYPENLQVDFFARAKVNFAGFIFTIVNMSIVLAEVPIGMSNAFLLTHSKKNITEILNGDPDDVSKVCSQ